MRFILPISFLFYASATALALPDGSRPATSSTCCLSYGESWDIASKWLSIWDFPNPYTSVGQLSSFIASDIQLYDFSGSGPYTTGPLAVGLDQLLGFVDISLPQAVVNETQVPVLIIYTCDTVVARWVERGYASGYNATVPAGTYIEFYGTEIIQVDLSTRLIYNVTSTGDWLNLAIELGQVGS